MSKISINTCSKSKWSYLGRLSDIGCTFDNSRAARRHCSILVRTVYDTSACPRTLKQAKPALLLVFTLIIHLVC